jgi:hypothetical protein
MISRTYGPDFQRFLTPDRFVTSSAEQALSSDPAARGRYVLGSGNPVENIEYDGHKLSSPTGPQDQAELDAKLKMRGDSPAGSGQRSRHYVPQGKRELRQVRRTQRVVRAQRSTRYPSDAATHQAAGYHGQDPKKGESRKGRCAPNYHVGHARPYGCAGQLPTGVGEGSPVDLACGFVGVPCGNQTSADYAAGSVLGLFGPGKVVGAAKAAKGALEAGRAALTARRGVGAAKAGEGAARSTFLASDGTEIVGFTRHGINRAIGDGAKRAGTRPEAILDAIKNPTKITEGVDDLGRPFKVYRGGDARVVINPETGRIVSVNPRSVVGAN